MRQLMSISWWINKKEPMTIHPRFMIVQLMQFIHRKEQIHNHNVIVLDDN